MARKPTIKLEDLDYHRWIEGKHYVCVSYRNAKGIKRQVHRRVDSIEEAIRVVDELKRQYQERGPAAWDGATMKWEELIEEYKKAHPKIKPWYLAPLAWFTGRKIRSITYGTCRQFREARENTPKRYTEKEGQEPKFRTVTTINREMEQLRTVLLFACRHGWLMRNPMLDGPSLIRRDEEDRRDIVPTPEQEAKLLSVCVEPRAHLRGLIIATRDTGLRRSALQKLDWTMVDWRVRLLRIPPNNNRYKKRPKVVGISDRLFDELWEMHEAATNQENFLPTEKIFPRKDFGRSYETACRLAGIEGIWFNDFRHGFATDLMEAGVPRDLAMQAAGHTNPETHGIYTNVDERLALQVVEKLNALHKARQGKNEEDSGMIQ